MKREATKREATKREATKRPAPPAAWEWLAGILFPDDGALSTVGDLAEVYDSIATTRGRAAANRWYRVQILRAVGPVVKHNTRATMSMIRNYFLSAARHLRKQALYTAINVCGLAIAIAFAALALLFLRSEHSYDKFHPGYKNTYRLATAVHFQQLEYWENTPYPLADALAQGVPAVERTTRLTAVPQRMMQIGDQRVEADVHMVSGAFLEFFHFPMRLGSAASALGTPNGVVISQALRRQYFRDENPVGETIHLNLSGTELIPFTVTGVVETPPGNSSIRFDLLISEALYPSVFGEGADTDWMPKSRTVTFFRAHPGADVTSVQSTVNDLALQHGLDRFVSNAEVENLVALERLDKVHFSSLIQNRILAANGDPAHGYTLAAVALLILVIACVNFMNLSVGLSAGRSREVGVRKVLGARRRQLVAQFWSESLLLSLAALVVGGVFALLILPAFNAIAGQRFAASDLANVRLAAGLLGLTVFIGIAAGSYPALILSGFNPSRVLHGRLQLRRGMLSRLMVTAQFAISIFLIACTLVMGKQLRHVRSLDLGYNAELLLLQTLPRGVDDATLDRFRALATLSPDVVAVSGARATLFGDAVGSAFMINHEGEPMTLASSKIDYDFLDVLGIPIVDGRNLSPDHPSDPNNAILVNQAFVRRFQLVDPVGQPAPFGSDNDPIIVGVVSDFHFMSLRNAIEPLVLNLRPESDYRQIITRIRGGDVPEALAGLEQAWNELDTDMTFSATFFDEAIRNQYRAEQNFRTTGTYASWMATLIACLGLFGMAALSVARRTKEVGIRKVLGASTERIVLLFHREYVVLLLLGAAIAWPAAHLVSRTWLQRFAEPVAVGWLVFPIATISVLAVAALTVSWQAIRAAKSDPVDSLRYE